MNKSKSMSELKEKLAAIEHERWADWQKWVHDKCYKHPDGLIIPQELVDRWERQIATKYKNLSEREKQSDRDQVDRYWNLITQHAKQIALEAIGEDIREFHDPSCNVIDSCYCSAKLDFKLNKLRQTQRTNLEKLTNHKEN